MLDLLFKVLTELKSTTSPFSYLRININNRGYDDIVTQTHSLGLPIFTSALLEVMAADGGGKKKKKSSMPLAQ